MMRNVILVPIFLVILSGGSAQGQYDFYDFMNSTGYGVAPRPSASPGAPRLAQNGESSGHFGQPLGHESDDLATLNELEMIESPSPGDRSILVPPQYATVPPALSGPLGEQNRIGNLGGEPVDFASTVAHPHHDVFGPAVAAGYDDPQAGWSHHAATGHCAGAVVMPYRQPNLPPPSSLYGHFNSPPCYAHLWDTYPQEAAARCARWRQATGPYFDTRGIRGELVEPCR